MLKNLELKIPPPILAAISLALILVTSKYLPTVDVFNLERFILFLVLLLFAICFPLLGILEFRKYKTTIDPRKPQKSTKLVTSGIYRITRNPMYVGLLLFLFSICVYKGSYFSLLYCLLFYLYVNRYQIRPEEKALLEIFGSDHIQYKKNIRRWL